MHEWAYDGKINYHNLTLIITKMANVFGQMKEMYKLQKEAKEMQKKLRDQKIVGESDDGRVKVFMNGAQELEDLLIDESLVMEGMAEVIRQGFKEAFKD